MGNFNGSNGNRNSGSRDGFRRSPPRNGGGFGRRDEDGGDRPRRPGFGGGFNRGGSGRPGGFNRGPRPGGFNRGGSGGQRFGGGGGFNSQRRDGPMEKFPAKCSGCGSDCEVPFKPTEGRKVFCSTCFKKQNRF